MLAPEFSTAILIAAFGWIATVVLIKRTPLSAKLKRLLVLPAWLPWIIVALGAPILSGMLTPTGALSIGGAVTLGVVLPTLISFRKPPR